MKKLRFTTDSESHAYMKKMQALNEIRSATNKNEIWFKEKLVHSTWRQQAIFGYRLFDFWNHNLLCAVEIDGPEHNREYDNYRDEYNFRRSGIVVLRVRNNNEMDAASVLDCISKLSTGRDRKIEIGITGNTKSDRTRLSSQPYDKNNLMFVDFLKSIGHCPYWNKDMEGHKK